jgi:hypothetical protein
MPLLLDGLDAVWVWCRSVYGEELEMWLDLCGNAGMLCVYGVEGSSSSVCGEEL